MKNNKLYNEHIKQVELSSFIPLVISTTGGMGRTTFGDGQ